MNLISTLISIAARLVLAVASIVLFLAVLAAGLVIFGVLMLWSLIRGRKPTFNNAAFQRAAQFRTQGFRTGPGMGQRGAPQGEVIDAEVREVPNADPRLER
ncbi:hypothetical protein [Roseateles chitosanitabidus]|uniref:hypothetical protein n=1 Tax=Roseateles chitosanitabidus TaxID=65048 RepID=UPI0008321835|nr:hypothetical protein [Roseateles chitosanitabidus]MBO9686282.1 hypothetical protein [Roseateles chitosanitabidus]